VRRFESDLRLYRVASTYQTTTLFGDVAIASNPLSPPSFALGFPADVRENFSDFDGGRAFSEPLREPTEVLLARPLPPFPPFVETHVESLAGRV
jgi:hypothetical protein